MNQTRKSCPIENNIGAVFIPVSDINRSVTWYNNLLGRPADIRFSPDIVSDQRTIYSISLGQVNLLLDSMNRDKSVPSQNVLFYLTTKDIRGSYEYLQDIGASILTPEDKAVHSIVVLDPDENKFKINVHC